MAIPFAFISQWELQVVNFAAAFTKGKAKKDYFLARKVLPGNCCKSCCFSKDRQVHESVTYFTMYSYNFCWPVRTLRVRESAAQAWQQRTPAMAAGLTDHVWSLAEWIDRPSSQRK